MKIKLAIALLIIFALHSICKAQLQFNWKVGVSQKENIPAFHSDNKPLFFQMNTERTFVYPQQIKYTLPKAAIFCRMEDALYRHFNVLIKVRMGTDDKYSN